MPAGGRPKPKLKQINARPKVRALYQYKAQDVDEIDIAVGEEFELVKEGGFEVIARKIKCSYEFLVHLSR